MTDIPASLTFDNLASIALKELKAPLQLKLNDLEATLKSLRKESIALEAKHTATVEALLRKQHSQLFSTMEKLGEIVCMENYLDRIDVSMYPTLTKGSGSISYTLQLKDSVMKKMATWKAFNKHELQCDKLHNQILVLRKELDKLDVSIVDVKEKVMEQFLAANPGHADFKNFIRQKISEASK